MLLAPGCHRAVEAATITSLAPASGRGMRIFAAGDRQGIYGSCRSCKRDPFRHYHHRTAPPVVPGPFLRRILVPYRLRKHVGRYRRSDLAQGSVPGLDVEVLVPGLAAGGLGY